MLICRAYCFFVYFYKVNKAQNFKDYKMDKIISYLQNTEKDYKKGIYSTIEYKNLLYKIETIIKKQNLNKY